MIENISARKVPLGSNPFTRRDLLKLVSASVSVGMLSQQAESGVSQPAVDFPTEPRARLAVTSYPFRAWIESPGNRDRNPKLPGMDLKAFPAFVAEHFGVRNINPLLAHFSSTEPDYLDAFRAAVDQARSRIVDLGLGDGAFYSVDPSDRHAAVDVGRKCIDVALHIGSPSVRQHVSGTGTPDVGRAAESLGQLAEHGAKRNVVVNLENDSPGSEDPFFLVEIIEKVNSPYLRALPDFGNSLVGHDQEYNKRAVQAMLAHAYNMCHVKDTVTNDKGEHLHVDLAPLFGVAKRSAYRGFFSMEYETESGDPIAGTRQLVEESLRYLG